MPKFTVITTTSLRTRYEIELPEGTNVWDARRFVNDDEERANLIGYPAGFEDDERVDDAYPAGQSVVD